MTVTLNMSINFALKFSIKKHNFFLISCGMSFLKLVSFWVGHASVHQRSRHRCVRYCAITSACTPEWWLNVCSRMFIIIPCFWLGFIIMFVNQTSKYVCLVFFLVLCLTHPHPEFYSKFLVYFPVVCPVVHSCTSKITSQLGTISWL